MAVREISPDNHKSILITFNYQRQGRRGQLNLAVQITKIKLIITADIIITFPLLLIYQYIK